MATPVVRLDVASFAIARAAAGLTVAEVADRIGIDRRSLYRHLSGARSSVSPDLVARISATFPGVPFDALFTVVSPVRDYLSAREVAERLGVSHMTVRRWAASGELPAIRLGGPTGPLRIASDDVAAWLAAQQKASA